MAKIKVDPALLERLSAAAQRAGYSSVEELVTHIMEKELARLENDSDDRAAEERLRGLGYIE
jgi:hypothetical protein